MLAETPAADADVYHCSTACIAACITIDLSSSGTLW
jgi:hypothetical protein